jgi:hypothetical protein
MPREDTQTLSFRGRRSRNKVSVGEPAEGSLSFLHPHSVYLSLFYLFVGVWCVCWRGSFSLSAPLVTHPASADSFGDIARRCLVCCRVFVSNPLESVCYHASPVSHKYTTLVDGYLGMNNDEERSEMRYVVRIAEFSESSKL